MFHYINGTVSELLPNLAVIDCGGVGFAINTSAYTVSQLKTGDKAKLYTFVYIREDCMDIYGFASKSEKHCFEMLIGVSGVGPKAAMSILSLLTPDKLSMAICGEDTKTIAKASGIGAKTAARVVLELKDKIAKQVFATTDAGISQAPISFAKSSNLSEALDALVVLGYSKAEAQRALSGIDPSLDVTKIIPIALSKLLK